MGAEEFDRTEPAGEPLRVEIRCLVPPTDEQKVRIRDFMCRRYGRSDVNLAVVRDPSVAEGFNIFVGDDNYDWTALGRVRQLRRKIQQSSLRKGGRDFISLLREDIESFTLDAGYQKVGKVLTVSDSIAVTEGLAEAAYGTVVLFECGIKGMVQDIRADGTTGIILFGDPSEITAGSRLVDTGRTAGIPISNRVLGRMIDPLGSPVDGKGPVEAKKYYPIERPAPGIMERRPVSRPLETGIMAIDSMFPIGRGQRELIIGDRQTGKTSVAVDTILNQKGKNVVCVYVAISQKASSVASVIRTLEAAGAMEYTVVVTSPASDPAAMQYIAPYTGCTVAEYFMRHGRDTLVIYDDLSKHAVAYRTISLLLGRAPGREAYPGDVFYLHSRLLERSAQLSDELGGGSMTALPIVETQAGDVSAYIPTNIISITDGQIFLDSEQFHSGQRPAVNVGLSVSRVGGAAQTDVMKKSVGSLRLDLAQFREMQVFSQFGSELDEQTEKQLRHGSALMQLLRQPNRRPLELWEQAVVLLAARERLFSSMPEARVPEAKLDLLTWFRQNRSLLIISIQNCRKFTPELGAEVTGAAKEFFASHRYQ
jgi:F-type H+-transporting ATPase subunit alpha